MSKSLLAVLAVISLAAGTFGVAQSSRDRSSDRRPEADLDRPLHVSGQVVTTDDSPLPRPLRVVMTCQNGTFLEDHADTNGYFSIEVRGSNPQRTTRAELGGLERATRQAGPRGSPRARESMGLGVADRERLNLAGCTLKAVARGYSSTSIALAVRRVLDSPDVGVIQISSGESQSGEVVRASTLATPREAVEAYERALNMLDRDKPDLKKAEDELEQAVSLHSPFAQAWRLLGRTRKAREDSGGARVAFEKAIEAEPALADAHLDLAQLLVDGGRWEESIKVTGSALEMFPDHSGLLYLHSLGHFNLRNFEEAEKAAGRISSTDEEHGMAGVHYILGATLAGRGDIANAARELERFLELSPSAPVAERVREQLQVWKEAGLLP